jgi:hypothetical protein
VADSTRLKRCIRRARLTSGAIGVGLFVALSAPAAHAAECAPTDLACLAKQGQDTIGGLGDKLGSGQDPVGGVTGTTGGVVKTVNDTLDGLLNGGGSGGSGGGPGGGSGGGSGNPRHHHGASSTIAFRGFPTTNGATSAAYRTSTTPVAPQRRSELLRSVGGTVVRAVQQVGFPMILAFIVALFVVVQNRLDRSDPKLSVAPLRPDRMRFV